MIIEGRGCAIFRENISNGVVYLTSDKIPFTHAFTTRLGGVSEREFKSLNLGEHRGDEPGNVRENYRRVGAALSIDYTRLVFSRQVHGSVVRVASEDDIHKLFEPAPYEADGLVTSASGLPLIVFSADCVPVLLCDEKNGVIAAVHCGWRGSAADILGEAIKKMLALGASADGIHAAIGPSIGKCCFETDSDVPDALKSWLGGGAEDFIKSRPETPGKYLCDIKGANRRRLEGLGISPENIDLCGECTVCEHEKYWSHRFSGGQRGSQASIIALT